MVTRETYDMIPGKGSLRWIETYGKILVTGDFSEVFVFDVSTKQVLQIMDLEVKCVARKANKIFFGVDNSVHVYDISEHSHPALIPLY